MLGRIFIGVVVIGSLRFSTASATKPQVPGLPARQMETSIKFEPKNPKLNDEVTVTFSFTVLDTLPVKERLNTRVEDIVEASLVIPSGGVLVQGSDKWKGTVEKGQRVEIRAVVKINQPGKHAFSGVVYSLRVKNIPPELEKKGVRSFHYMNSITSEEFNVSGTLPKKKPKKVVTESGVTLETIEGTAPAPGVIDIVPPKTVPESTQIQNKNQPDTGFEPEKNMKKDSPDNNGVQSVNPQQVWTVSGNYKVLDNFGFLQNLNQLLIIFQRKDGLGNWVTYDSW